MHTTVAIVGAGPAGLTLARLLHRAGIDCVVLEARDQDYVQRRQRAGTLEHSTVQTLTDCGVSDRLKAEGLVHDGIEIRSMNRSHRIDLRRYAGRSVTLYPQTAVVSDLIEANARDGIPMLFNTPVTRVEGYDSRPRVYAVHERRARRIDCDFVAGCDGFHGVIRRSLPTDRMRMFTKTWPFSWLGILADAPPSCNEIIYAHSDRGFALHSMRGRTRSRLYLQVPNNAVLAEWPDNRVWDELDHRLAVDGSWNLRRGPTLEKSIVPLRSVVVEPMRLGNVFLVGDAAHIVPPTGAKGMNLAVSDSRALAKAFESWHSTGSQDALDEYSGARLERVWKVQQFCSEMTAALHNAPNSSKFDERLQHAWLSALLSSPTAAADFAERYTGG